MQLLANSKQLLDTQYSQVATRFEPDFGLFWILFNQADDVPCFNEQLLSELFHLQNQLKNSGGSITVNGQAEKMRFSVSASLTPGVYNLGGELKLFSQLIKTGNKETLHHYAKKCIDVIAQRVDHYNLDLTTITLIQGDTLGGGFEAALTSDIIIAERGSVMGFPEILFNLFPGMGAYSLIARKVGTQLAEKIILSGKMYKAEELHEMGLVDVIAEPRQGENAVYEYISKQERRANGFQAVQRARQRYNPVTYAELMDITEIWVDAALKLNEKDLKVMDRFVRSQERLFTQVPQRLVA